MVFKNQENFDVKILHY